MRGPKCEKVRKPWVVRLKRWKMFEHACACLTKSAESGKDCNGVVTQKGRTEAAEPVISL